MDRSSKEAVEKEAKEIVKKRQNKRAEDIEKKSRRSGVRKEPKSESKRKAILKGRERARKWAQERKKESNTPPKRKKEDDAEDDGNLGNSNQGTTEAPETKVKVGYRSEDDSDDEELSPRNKGKHKSGKALESEQQSASKKPKLSQQSASRKLKLSHDKVPKTSVPPSDLDPGPSLSDGSSLLQKSLGSDLDPGPSPSDSSSLLQKALGKDVRHDPKLDTAVPKPLVENNALRNSAFDTGSSKTLPETTSSLMPSKGRFKPTLDASRFGGDSDGDGPSELLTAVLSGTKPPTKTTYQPKVVTPIQLRYEEEEKVNNQTQIRLHSKEQKDDNQMLVSSSLNTKTSRKDELQLSQKGGEEDAVQPMDSNVLASGTSEPEQSTEPTKDTQQTSPTKWSSWKLLLSTTIIIPAVVAFFAALYIYLGNLSFPRKCYYDTVLPDKDVEGSWQQQLHGCQAYLPCPEHGVCSGGKVQHCSEPYILIHDQCHMPGYTQQLLEKAEENLRLEVVDHVCKNIWKFKTPVLPSMPLNKVQEICMSANIGSQWELCRARIFPDDVFQSTGVYEIGYQDSYAKNLRLPTKSCSIQFLLRNNFLMLLGLLAVVVALCYIRWLIQRKNKAAKLKPKIVEQVFDRLKASSDAVPTSCIRDELHVSTAPDYLLKKLWPDIVKEVEGDDRVRIHFKDHFGRRQKHWKWSGPLDDSIDTVEARSFGAEKRKKQTQSVS